jgi:glycerol-3-phosphate acyltransferase PlsY
VGVFVKVGIGTPAGGSAKEPAGVRPGKAVARRVGVLIVVGVNVVQTVVGYRWLEWLLTKYISISPFPFAAICPRCTQ